MALLRAKSRERRDGDDLLVVEHEACEGRGVCE